MCVRGYLGVNEPMYLRGSSLASDCFGHPYLGVYHGIWKFDKIQSMSTGKKSRFDPWHLSKTTLWTNKSSPYVSPRPGGWVGERVHPAGISGVKRQFPNHSNGHHLFRHESRRSRTMKVMLLAFKTRPCPTTTLQSTRMSQMTPQRALRCS